MAATRTSGAPVPAPANPHRTPPRPGDPAAELDGLDAMVRALVDFLACDGAAYLEVVAGRPTPVRQWQARHAEPAAPEVLPDAMPTWGADLVEQARQHAGTLWRAAPGGAGGAVAVPLTRDESTVGVLFLHGRSMRPPDPTIGPLLDATAALLVRGSHQLPRESVAAEAEQTGPAPTSAAHGEVGPGGTEGDPEGPHQAMALVDVFAFTVKIVDGELEWRYLGPNSEAVFGFALTRADTLPGLVRRHVHHDDAAAAEAFLEAVGSGVRAEVELRMTGKRGASHWVSWRAVPRAVGGAVFVDGVATDVSARHSLGRSRRELAEARRRYSREVDVRREHARAVRDANDSVLQRLFATGLRLQALQRRLDDTEAHAASAIAFQLDQAVSDLREVILGLNGVVEGSGDSGRE